MADTQRNTATANGTGAGPGAAAADALFAGLGEMRARCRALDWAGTPLGPVADWPLALREAARLTLATPFPACLWCGPQYVLLYNDAYRRFFGVKHPAALGRPAAAVWNEVWPQLEPQLERVRAGGPAPVFEDLRFVLERGSGGAPEEAWFTYAFVPVHDEAGTVVAVHNPSTETTGRVRAERALTELVAASPAVMAVYSGPEHVITYVNPKWEQLVGKPDALGRPFRDVFPEMAGTGLPERLGQVYASGEPYAVEELPVPLQRRPGGPVEESFWSFLWEPAALPAAAASDEPAGGTAERTAHGREVTASGLGRDILCHAIDVTPQVRARREVERLLAESERARAEAEAARAALTESERQFRTLADAIPTLAWTARPDGHIDWFNARWYEYTGTTPEQMAGWGWQSVHDPAELPRVLERWREGIVAGQPVELTFPLRGADGRFRPFLTRVVPLRDSDGQVIRWFGTNTDVSPERAARDAAEAANRAKGEFLAVMSHELRTPLNAIGGYAELIELEIHGPVTEAQRTALARIQASQRHLLGLIAGVLDYSRVEAGAVTYRLVDVLVTEAVAEAETLVAPQLRAKGLGYAWAGATSDLAVRADREKLQQILLNVLSNAVKFTYPRGGAAGRIEVVCTIEAGPSGAAAAGDRVQIQVRDTGDGIATDELERIFEPFVQADQRLTRPHGGVGLGLAISRDLARGMGGDLTVESTAGVGSAFTLTLPRAG